MLISLYPVEIQLRSFGGLFCTPRASGCKKSFIDYKTWWWCLAIQAYADDNSNYGLLALDLDWLQEAVLGADNAGLQVRGGS